jgi:hypothetical protein
MHETLLALMVVAIPIVAIVGGITAGIVRTLARQRIIELAQRERIAAIERGLDPSKLPPLPDMGEGHEFFGGPLAFEYAQKRRSQGLMIGGIIMVAIGWALMAMMTALEPGENRWAVGIVPMAVGIALLISGWLVRPRNKNGSGAPPAPLS